MECFAHENVLKLFQVVGNLRTADNAHSARISCLGVADDGSAVCTGSWDRNLKVIHTVNLHNVHFKCLPIRIKIPDLIVLIRVLGFCKL